MGLTKHEEESAKDHARRVREMFARISPRYDLLNHLLSANIDRRWRKVVARRLREHLAENAVVLDVACGTGDLSIELFEKAHAQVVGIDFCRPMLEIAARKTAAISLVEGDALRLPFADEKFDGVAIAFGLRNLSSVEDGLRELRRILRPQGWAFILEFSKPVVPGFRWLFSAYSNRLLPGIGGWLSGSRGAYRYLPDSVSRFPDQATLAEIMRRAGFVDVAFENLTGGIAALHTGRRE